MGTITFESIPITLGREDDGRWWADIESMPGVMAYGDTREAAIAFVRALALRVAADCIDHGEEVSGTAGESLLSRISHWRSVEDQQLLVALLRIGWAEAWRNGSHRRLKRAGWANYTFSFHDEETKSARDFWRRWPRKTGLKPEDL